MSNLFIALRTTANSLNVFQKSLATVQNNVANVNTPGFVKQREVLTAMPFDPDHELPGGVFYAGTQSTRDRYADKEVRNRQGQFGWSDELAAGLSRIELVLDPSGERGIPKAINQLFQSFSALSVSPNDAVARRVVIDNAGEVARTIQSVDKSFGDASANAAQQAKATVDDINRLVGIAREINAQIRSDRTAAKDPALDAKLNTTLDDLSELINLQVLYHGDGSVTLLQDGQTPLLSGESQITLETGISSGRVVVTDSEGRDITAQVRAGRLKGHLEQYNEIIPGLQSDLNRLASTLADRVNSILAAGVDAGGAPGAALFQYSSSSDAARTLSVTSITAFQIAAATSSAPRGNGNALALAGLGQSQEIDGFTFVGFYGTISANLGNTLRGARADQEIDKALVSQAQSLRSDLSGVSLDEEAVRMMEFQRSLQAITKMFQVLDELTQDIINMMG